MTHVQRLLFLIVVGLIVLVHGKPARAQNQSSPQQTVDHLWTTFEQIRPARFHGVWAFAGSALTETERKSSIGRLGALFTRFGDEFRELTAAKGAKPLPAGVTLTPPPLPEDVLPSASWAEFKQTVNALALKVQSEKQTGVEDVFFCYVLTHGAGTGKDARLQFSERPVERDDVVQLLRAAIKTSGARLAVLITDNCSTPATEFASVTPASDDFNEQHFALVWRALYFGDDGLISISTSSPGETAYIDGATSRSRFLTAFSDALNLDNVPAAAAELRRGGPNAIANANSAFFKHIDLDNDEFITWEEFKEHLNKVMKSLEKPGELQAIQLDRLQP